jgi:hypothetical protein
MKSSQTDNSYFEDKVMLRINSLPLSDPIKVLDIFSGTGLLWKEIKQKTGREIITLSIDKKPSKDRLVLPGDNRKYRLDYAFFDIVDLDAYGVPYHQLEDIFKRCTTKIIVHLTYIQSIFGRLPRRMLYHLGYTKSMIDKCPSLFDKNGQEKLLKYLGTRGVKKITLRDNEGHRKTYGYFEWDPTI